MHVIPLPTWLKISHYWSSLHEWMPRLSLLFTSPIVATPQLFETTFDIASSLLEWISPLGLLSNSLIVVAPQFPEVASKASSGVVY